MTAPKGSPCAIKPEFAKLYPPQYATGTIQGESRDGLRWLVSADGNSAESKMPMHKLHVSVKRGQR